MLNWTIDDMLIQTNQRKDSFELMLNHLKNQSNPLIIETGCARSIHGSLEMGFYGDGNSTLIFDKFISEHGGELFTVDKDPIHLLHTKRMTGPQSTLVCQDSVKFLWDMQAKLAAQDQFVDLLYLDSYDLDPKNHHPSALHHLKELLAIRTRLKSGSMIAVDDNLGTPHNRQGKGAYIEEFMQNIGIPLKYDGYQLIWVL
jgi:hypothetical protein